MAGSDTHSSVKADLIADIQTIHKVHKGISRKIYRKYGGFSDRQLRNHFGTFRHALVAAGLLRVTSTPPTAAPVPNTPTLTQANAVPTGKPTETVETTGTGMTITKVSRIHTIEGLIEHFKIDLELWEAERFVANSWEMAGFPKAVGASGDWSRDSTDPIITPLYQVKATFVKKKVAEFAKLELESLKARLKEELSGLYPAPKPIVRAICSASGNMLELNVPDLHAGKLAWSKETGYKDYDTNIALDTFDEAVDTLLARSAHIHFDQITFVIGNDMMHSDTIAGTTTSGTQLDNDSRYHKTFVKLRNRVIDIIKYKLLPIAPVKVISCPGNHDKLSAWHLADSLDMYFHGGRYGSVEVNNSPEEFKFVQWGEVMLMFAHGNTGKKPDYPLTMATRQKEMWATTKFREAHTGHIHQTMVQEFHGVRVRVLPALCEPDAWHAANNFVGNLKVAEAYAWNDKQGLINKAFYNAD